MSLPVRGAWIEILVKKDTSPSSASLPVRGAWIEIDLTFFRLWEQMSLPVRGAWIEIYSEDTNLLIPVRRSL